MLSTRYLGDEAKLRLRCAQGHRFQLSSGHLVQGRWCRTCGIAHRSSRNRPTMVARLRQIVSRRSGTLLSPNYVNNLTKLRYRCAEGHEWEAVPASLFIGRWCPECASRKRGDGRRLAVLRRLRERVSGAGYELLPPGFVDAHTHILLRCPRGHLWQTLYASFEEGSRCPRCRQERLLDELRAFAERWSGECLEQSVRSNKQPIAWRCAQGHRFIAPGERIRRGSWCPRCRSVDKGELQRMGRLARQRGGECLSPSYTDASHKLRWRCREGHEWRADPGSIVQGSWCPICRHRGGHSLKRLSIEIMREMAKQRGGACLSPEYHGSMVGLRWRCARGHSWRSVPSGIRRGNWCPVCAHTVRGTLDGMRALALEQGGRCLSRSWDNHREPLFFECARGHGFRLNANVAKSGVWCPTCAGR